MGLIYQTLELRGRKRKRKVRILMDSGSTHSLIREDIARDLGELHDLPEPKEFHSVVGEFTAREGVMADVVVRRHRLMTHFTAVRSLTEEAILGVDFFERYHIRLDPKRKRLILDPDALVNKAGGGRHRA